MADARRRRARSRREVVASGGGEGEALARARAEAERPAATAKRKDEAETPRRHWGGGALLALAVAVASPLAVAHVHGLAEFADGHVGPDAALVLHVLYSCQSFPALWLFGERRGRGAAAHALACAFWPLAAAFAGTCVDDVASGRGVPLLRVSPRQWRIAVGTWAAHHAAVAPAVRLASKRAATAWRALVLYGEAHAKATSCLKAFRAWAFEAAVALRAGTRPAPALLLAGRAPFASAVAWCGLRGAASTWVKVAFELAHARGRTVAFAGVRESARYALLALAYAAATAYAPSSLASLWLASRRLAPSFWPVPANAHASAAAPALAVLALRGYLAAAYVPKALL